MPPIMIVRSWFPAPAADPAVEPPPVALFAQPARTSEPTIATRASAFHREGDIVISFRSRGCGNVGTCGVSDCGHVRGARRWTPAQNAFLEQGDECFGGQGDDGHDDHPGKNPVHVEVVLRAS